MKDVTRIRYKRNSNNELVSEKYHSEKSLYQVKLLDHSVVKIIDLVDDSLVHFTEEGNLRSAQRKARKVLMDLGVDLLQEIRVNEKN